MERTSSVCSILVLCAVYGQAQAPAVATPPRNAPVCQVEPSWPRVPEDWIFGAMAGIATDSKDNVWIVHRAAGTVSSLAFSPGADQQYLYVADQAEDVILVLDRQTLTRWGRAAGSAGKPGSSCRRTTSRPTRKATSTWLRISEAHESRSSFLQDDDD
jgi:hypothetical protein